MSELWGLVGVAFDPVDVHVGARVRQRRVLLGLSQSKLGQHIGVTFQQMQKYESGANRISASRLWRLARELDVPVQYFFEEMGDDPGAPAPAGAESFPPPAEGSTSSRESLELLRGYYAIQDADLRRTIRQMIKAIERKVAH